MIDLCAGTGCVGIAFESTQKVKCIFANDIEKHAKTMTELNGNPPFALGDLLRIPTDRIPPHDILTAGFSCQPFSLAGEKKGFDDERSDIIWKIFDIMAFHTPRVVVLENVKNLLTHDGGKTFQTITARITEMGYYYRHTIIDTSEITGIPQHRERLFIVCFRNKPEYDAFSLDFPKMEKRPIREFLEPAETVAPKYYYNERTKIWDMLKINVVKPDVVYQYRRTIVRENKSGECPTLTANMGGGGHNVPIILDGVGIRKLTPRECFRLQGFPESYVIPTTIADCNLYKLAGNAITYKVMEMIAGRVV
jgi:DNA (cytosine-5)-methyltransferase 1